MEINTQTVINSVHYANGHIQIGNSAWFIFWKLNATMGWMKQISLVIGKSQKGENSISANEHHQSLKHELISFQCPTHGEQFNPE